MSHPSYTTLRDTIRAFFAYDLNRTLERLPLPPIPAQGSPQSMLHFYDVVLSFDHRDGRCWVVSSGWPEQDSERRIERACRRADEFVDCLTAQKHRESPRAKQARGIQTSVGKATLQRYAG
ncbi:hypothetical protein [Bradyrhizobium sp. LMG 9283]|uniref:hypothetical protein n=1 Tax=Bradyrhizobium sp. LMG 9283 TaxID=592064 RepID=UPI00388D66EE